MQIVKRDKVNAVQRIPLNADCVFIKILQTVLPMSALAIALVVNTPPVLAADELDQLRMTGTIKSVNAGTGLVMVDVTSSTCHGLREFKADDPEKMEDYLEQTVAFFINSSKCEVREIYTILTVRGLRK